MNRFVILEHDHPHRHWDLMLDVGDALATWRLSMPPDQGTPAVESIANHRRAYLDYEGPISGDRGTVVRWDRGTYRRESAEIVELFGERWCGRLDLTVTAPSQALPASPMPDRETRRKS